MKLLTAILVLMALSGCSDKRQVGVMWEPEAATAGFYRSRIINGTNYQVQMGFRSDGLVMWRYREIKQNGGM